jgi:hypothetical protein
MTGPHAGTGAWPPTVAVREQEHNAAVIAVAWVVAVVTGLYMLPWAVAATRGKTNSGTVALVNVLLGWTVIGWIAALVMALGAHPVRYVAVEPGWHGGALATGPSGWDGPPVGWYPDPGGRGQRFWDGERWTEHTLP